MNASRTVLATVTVTALVAAVVAARRAGVLGSSVTARLPSRRRYAPSHSRGADAPFTSRPVPRSVAALAPAEQADSAMVHDGG
ncbi:MAG TPA: hypothetical protein VER39_10525 [Nocardioidaceae bacterium]|nr:hypothetical protein [Nocardioidaceae bacterium]